MFEEFEKAGEAAEGGLEEEVLKESSQSAEGDGCVVGAVAGDLGRYRLPQASLH